jgi:hypothetical protein
VGAAGRGRARFPLGQVELTPASGNRDPPAMVDEPGSRDDRTMDSDPVIADLPRPTRPDAGWVDGIDVFEHHCIDFDRVVAQGVKVAIVRAGRGTRQDSRWIEHVTAAHRCGLAVASYWHVYPSRADAHRQAELFVAAIRSADVPFDYGQIAVLQIHLNELGARLVVDGVFECSRRGRGRAALRAPAVQAALGDDHVGVALARLDEPLVRGAHLVEVLLDHELGCATPLGDVPTKSPDQPDVGGGVDEDLEVEPFAQGPVPEHEDAVDDDDPRRFDHADLGAAVVLGVVVHRAPAPRHRWRAPRGGR